jgi:hypothetical protein
LETLLEVDFELEHVQAATVAVAFNRGLNLRACLEPADGQRDARRCRRPSVFRKNQRRAPFDSSGHRLEAVLVVQSAEDWHRDDSMTITYLMATGG